MFYMYYFSSLGEPFSMKLIDLIVRINISNCNIWNVYGPAETTISSIAYLVDITKNLENIPIGYPSSKATGAPAFVLSRVSEGPTSNTLFRLRLKINVASHLKSFLAIGEPPSTISNPLFSSEPRLSSRLE